MVLRRKILEIDLHLKVYDRDFDKLKFKLLINIYNVKVMCNKLIIQYYENKNKIKSKSIFFKDPTVQLFFIDSQMFINIS